ncbi:MAG: CoA transferase [Syntrophaceae bacterium]|nr:CoA transferase [Syntrophaceae bacterium]
MKSPLEGLVILDMTRFLSGPFCTMLLGDMGAEVIKIEPPETGDDTRAWAPFIGGQGSYYLSTNRNKKSICVDTRKDEGNEVLRRMVGKADVFVENFKPGLMDRLGLDFKSMIALNPRLIYCSISGFGQTGPCRDRPGYDQILQGMSGLMSITGTEESGPVRVGLAIGDIITALFATYGILSALYAREKTRKGQWVTTSILEATVGILTMQSGKYFATGQPPGPAGNHHPVISPYGVYRTKDKPMNIAVGTEAMWRNFCRVIGSSELAKDERFQNNNDRVKNRTELNALIEKALSRKDQHEWVETLNKAGIPCGPIYTLDQVFRDPQVLHQKMFLEVEHPKSGKIPMTGLPVQLSETSPQVFLPPPHLGEHTGEILEKFGFSDKEVQQLFAEKIVT